MRHHGIGTRARDAHILAGLCRRAGFGVFVDRAIAIGVENERRPALRLDGIAGLIPDFGIDPAGHGAGPGEPQCIVGVIAELRMMSAKAGIDEAVLHCLGIEHGGLPPRAIDRKRLRGRVIGILFAKRRIIDAAH